MQYETGVILWGNSLLDLSDKKQLDAQVYILRKPQQVAVYRRKQKITAYILMSKTDMSMEWFVLC